MKNNRQKGSSVLEVIVTGSFMALATLGLAGSMVTASTVGARSARTIAQVSTAENLIEQMRQASTTDLAGVATKYTDMRLANNTSVGLLADAKRQVHVTIPLTESDIPGTMDLNGDGVVSSTAVDPANARLLMIDIQGMRSMRIRTAMFNPKNMLRQKGGGTGASAPVSYGETRTPGSTPPTTGGTTGGTTTTTPPANPTNPNPSGSTVDVTASAGVGKSIEILLKNNSTGDRKVTQITVAPNKSDRYFQSIMLDGKNIFTAPNDQKSGTVTIDITTDVVFAPGEVTLKIDGFYKIKKGKVRMKDPGAATITIAFDDGSVVSTEVAK